MHLLFLFSTCLLALHDSRFRPGQGIMIHSHVLGPEDPFRGFSIDGRGLSPIIIRKVRYNVPSPVEFARYGIRRDEHPRLYSRPFRSPSTTAAHAARGDLEKTQNGGVPILSSVVFLILIGISGAIGFYLGKMHESRNYVRVPAAN